MPDGKTHFGIWKAGWIIVAPLSIFTSILVNPVTGVGELIGYGIGSILDPDLDIMGTSNAESRMVNKIPVFGHILYGYSSIYGSVFRGKHRSFWTHFPIISTGIRILYFFWWIGLLYYYNIISYNIWQLFLFLGFYIGLSLADFLHWGADTMFEPVKKTKKKRYKR